MMRRVVVYPDNSVSIDGQAVCWSAKEFRRYGIAALREVVCKKDMDGAEIKLVDGLKLVVFPNVPLTRKEKHRCKLKSTLQQIQKGE